MITIKQKVHFSRGKAGRRRIATKPQASETVPIGSVPRISKLMALAIRFDGLIRAGKVGDQSELSRLTHITQPRMTQIMNLLHLAPDIQEELLFLPAIARGRAPLHEKILRPITTEIVWGRQRELWARLVGGLLCGAGDCITKGGCGLRMAGNAHISGGMRSPKPCPLDTRATHRYLTQL